MKRNSMIVILSAGSLGLAACAQSSTVGEGPSPSSSASVPAARWSANIQSVTESRSDISQSARARSYGSATITRSDVNNLTMANIVFNHSGSDRFLNWAIHSGSCGSPSLPLLPISNFPELQVGGGGRAQVTAQIPLEFPVTGEYHVNIYKERQQTRDALVACGNFRPSGV